VCCGWRTLPTTHSGAEGLVEVSLFSFFNFGARSVWDGQLHAPAAFHPGRDLVHTLQEAGWVPGPVEGWW